MRWPAVMEAVLAELRADPAVTGIVGNAIWLAGSRKLQYPSIEYTPVSDIEGEVTNAILVQFDLWVRDGDQLVTLEGRLRKLLHRDTPIELGGVWMWMQYQDSRFNPGSEPGMLHKSLDIRFEPLRDKYLR